MKVLFIEKKDCWKKILLRAKQERINMGKGYNGSEQNYKLTN